MLKRILLAILLLFILFSAAIFLLKDRILISMAEERLSRALGAAVRIEGFSWDIMASSLEVKGLKVYNPAGFPQEKLLDLPGIYIEYDLSALLKKELHLAWLELDSREVVVIKDREGKLNLQELKAKNNRAPKEQAAKGPLPKKSWPLRIDVLKLKLGRVVYKDYSLSGKPKVEVYELAVDKTYKNITRPQQVFDLMLLESLKPTALKGAAVYGLLSVAGSQLLPPVGFAVALTGKDSAKADFPVPFTDAFRISLEGADELGDIVRSDEKSGMIKANIRGSEAIVRVLRKSEKTTTIAVSARRYFFPKPRIAEGLLYQISDKFK